MAFQKRTLPGVKELWDKVNQSIRNAVLPIGTIVAYYGDLSSIPSGWRICDGTGGTPNLINRYLRGSMSAGKYTQAGLPNIRGYVGETDLNYGAPSGAFYSKTGNPYEGDIGDGGSGWITYFDASRYDPIYGRSTTVTPETIDVIFIMKMS